MEEFNIRLKKALMLRDISQTELCEITGIPKSAMSQYLSGNFKPKQTRTYFLAQALNVSPAWLMGYDVPIEPDGFSATSKDNTNKFFAPNITNDYVTFPVIGDIAAGYDDIAVESWEGELIDIPVSYLKGREQNEFFVLRVKGDSMYPLYHENDKVLILKQTTLNNSGDIGAVLYDDEIATLKKVEYVMGEDWLKLIPINPNVPPMRIEGEQLEHCRILGIPKLVIREV